MILGGPALYLLGESLFRWRMTGVPKAPRMAVAALLLLLAPLGGHVEALPLSIVVAALLTVLAVWDCGRLVCRIRRGKSCKPRGSWRPRALDGTQEVGVRIPLAPLRTACMRAVLRELAHRR